MIWASYRSHRIDFLLCDLTLNRMYLLLLVHTPMQPLLQLLYMYVHKGTYNVILWLFMPPNINVATTVNVAVYTCIIIIGMVANWMLHESKHAQLSNCTAVLEWSSLSSTCMSFCLAIGGLATKISIGRAGDTVDHFHFRQLLGCNVVHLSISMTDLILTMHCGRCCCS